MSSEVGLTAVVAALPDEVRPLLSRIEEGPISDRIAEELLRRGPEDSGRLRRTLDAARFRAWGAGRFGEIPVVVAATGDGPELAERGVEALLEAARPERLVVVGVAGALESSLSVGDVVRATEVWSGTSRVATDPELAGGARSGAYLSGAQGEASPGPGRPGAVVTAGEIVSTPGAREELWRRVQAAGSDAETAVVDLETAVYVRAALEHGVAWSVFRAVSDPADESLPGYLEACRDEQGSVRSEAVALRALSHPGSIPTLIRLRSRVGRSADRLADHVQEAARVEWAGTRGAASGAGT